MMIILYRKCPDSESKFLKSAYVDARVSYTHNTVRHRKCKLDKQMANGRTCYALIQIE